MQDQKYTVIVRLAHLHVVLVTLLVLYNLIKSQICYVIIVRKQTAAKKLLRYYFRDSRSL